MSLRSPERSPPAKRQRGRSASPEQREYMANGGGRSSSRNRSPGYYRSGRDEGYSGRSRRDEVEPRRRESGRERERERDEGYGQREREKERDVDRKRYEEGAVEKVAEAAKPNFGASGLLAKETNTVKGVELKYNEPPEARKPLKNWRLYVFKGEEQIDLIHIYRQSAYLVGRDTVVTDIPIAHPSCSKQHAVIQYRQIQEKNEYGDVTTTVKPFIIDLDSTNGTYVNDQEIPKSRYYELRNADVIKFGTSSREYVLLHEEASA
ncbi:hypothetical protein EHS25_009214 [Saitozyma podzolica]|uniref:FHA domain-containing protein n=1 Tax=Saitozyma podzolica TaxID=1890683 RepID=A0A427YL65_9TREE|nr:hypothetical protein EHS25_009214 [Saitozyma podzolica]